MRIFTVCRCTQGTSIATSFSFQWQDHETLAFNSIHSSSPTTKLYAKANNVKILLKQM